MASSASLWRFRATNRAPRECTRRRARCWSNRLGVAAELHDLQAGLGERGADVGGGGRLADAALAVNGDLFDLFSHLQSLRCAAKTERGLGGTFAAVPALRGPRRPRPRRQLPEAVRERAKPVWNRRGLPGLQGLARQRWPRAPSEPSKAGMLKSLRQPTETAIKHPRAAQLRFRAPMSISSID